jgi:hypothetical protein
VWIAREYVAAGQPVCNYYKWMTNDISLLQYGWLQVCMCGSCNMRDQGVMAACTVLYCECCARGLHFFVPTCLFFDFFCGNALIRHRLPLGV